LDNVFSILCFAALALHLMDLKNKHLEEVLRWVSLIITLWCQEKGFRILRFRPPVFSDSHCVLF
jgi:hypothetical protein